MAELRTPLVASSAGTALRQNTTFHPAVDWPMPADDDVDVAPEPKGCIELHGSAYIAFCKPWAPLFVAPEDAEDAS
jgi:hypothetical protein